MRNAVFAATLLVPVIAQAKAPPKCEHWPEMMALGALKNAGIVDPTKIDQTATKATLLAAQPTPRKTYKEVYDITYVAKTGEPVTEVITSSEASDEECSVSGVSTFVVSKQLP